MNLFDITKVNSVELLTEFFRLFDILCSEHNNPVEGTMKIKTTGYRDTDFCGISFDIPRQDYLDKFTNWYTRFFYEYYIIL